MSLAFPPNGALDIAVRNSITAGVTYVVGAGNNGLDASTQSPARVAEAITVAATDSSDNRAVRETWASNFGPLVDVFAPGVDVLSAWWTSDAATAMLGGTSMAAPPVTGLVAQYLQKSADDSPAAVATAVINNATTGVVVNPGAGSPNRLLFSNFITPLAADSERSRNGSRD